MKIKVSYLLIVFILFLTNPLKTQTFSKKVFYGGNLGFSIESNYWMINITPLLGYRFTPSLASGVTALYEYEKHNQRNPNYSINSYGGGVFLRYDLGATLMRKLPFSIFFQTDYEGRQQEIRYNSTIYKNYSEFENRLYLGAGYSHYIGSRTRAFLMISIDLLHLGNNSARPVVRAGIEL